MITIKDIQDIINTVAELAAKYYNNADGDYARYYFEGQVDALKTIKDLISV